MKKSILVLIIILVAAVSSAATIGVMKLVENYQRGGPIIILSDERCVECNVQNLENSFKRIFPNDKYVVLDYGNPEGKKLYDSEKLTALPAVLLPKGMETSEAYKKVARFAEVGDKYIQLKTGGTFDPKAEICDNEKDDNGDKLVDCEDPTCKGDWKCMEKREKPAVDIFVMSHCPYGTQIEKGLLPVWDLIGDKVDLNIRFVDYAMHGKKEVDEQLRQYCIQKGGKEQYKKYLKCFLKEGKTDDTCIKEVKVNKAELDKCIKKADKEFGISRDFEDKTKWKGRFPPFSIHSDLAKKHEVKGSPTLVINDVVAKSGRSPTALLDAICQGFKEKPKECETKLDAINPSPGFGFKKGEAKSDAKCGG